MSDPHQILTDADRELLRADRLLEVAHVAKRLRKCPETIRRWIRSGKLRAVRMPATHRRGSNYLIPESAIASTLLQVNISRHD